MENKMAEVVVLQVTTPFGTKETLRTATSKGRVATSFHMAPLILENANLVDLMEKEFSFSLREQGLLFVVDRWFTDIFRYEGEFRQGEFEGKGCLTCVNGSVFDGIFHNGNFEVGDEND